MANAHPAPERVLLFLRTRHGHGLRAYALPSSCIRWRATGQAATGRYRRNARRLRCGSYRMSSTAVSREVQIEALDRLIREAPDAINFAPGRQCQGRRRPCARFRRRIKLVLLDNVPTGLLPARLRIADFSR